MKLNLLHINLSKSVYMHFRPGRYSSCARARQYGCEKYLKLDGYSLTKVDKVKFLGVIIDNELNWEPQIDHLKEKLNASIAIIKRIMKFIPMSEYHKLYDSLFKSHLSYCISCWGGIPSHQLKASLPYRRGVYTYYLVKSLVLIMHLSMKPVHVPDHTAVTWRKRIMNLRTQNLSLLKRKYYHYITSTCNTPSLNFSKSWKSGSQFRLPISLNIALETQVRSYLYLNTALKWPSTILYTMDQNYGIVWSILSWTNACQMIKTLWYLAPVKTQTYLLQSRLLKADWKI